MDTPHTLEDERQVVFGSSGVVVVMLIFIYTHLQISACVANYKHCTNTTRKAAQS